MLALVWPTGMPRTRRTREARQAGVLLAAVLASIVVLLLALVGRVLPFIWPIRMPGTGTAGEAGNAGILLATILTVIAL